jgi:hypothetical protein
MVSPDLSSTFYPFGRLPLELRQHIWELAIEPREVQIKSEFDFDPWYYYSPTPVPAVLQVCRESRHYLESPSFYRQAFTEIFDIRHQPRYIWTDFNTRRIIQRPRYIWTNFNIDTISLTQSHLAAAKTEATSIRYFITEVEEQDFLINYHIRDLKCMHALEILTFRVDDQQRFEWSGWLDLMEEVIDAFRDERLDEIVPFVRIIDLEGFDMNSKNWRNLDRAKRRLLAAEDLERYGTHWEVSSDSSCSS